MNLRRFAFALLLAAAPGCGDKKPAPPPAPPPPHVHHAPHGGTLVELGNEEAHVELVVDPKTGSMKAYVLDAEAEKPIRISLPEIPIVVRIPGGQPVLVSLQPRDNPLTGETVTHTSEFAGQLDALKDLKEWDGSIRSITVQGTIFDNVGFHFPTGNEQEKK